MALCVTENTMPFTLDIGAQAPAFELPGTDGKIHRLSDFAAAPLLIVCFTCNHCPHVLGNESREKTFVEQYSPRGIAYVAINSNETKDHPNDDFEHMKLRAARLNFTWPYLRDETQAVAKAYGAIKTPHFFLFDRDRTLRYVGRMNNSPRDATLSTTHELADATDDLLAGRPVRVPVTQPVGCTLKWWGKDSHFIPHEACDLV